MHRGKQRPTTPALQKFEHARRLSGQQYIERTRTQPSPLSTVRRRPSVSAPRAVRRHLGRGRRRCVSVLVNLRLPKHRGTPRPETSRAGSGPSGPSNKLLVRRGHLVSISRLHDRGSVVTEMRRGSWELEQDQRLQQPPASSSRPADHTPGASDYSSPWRGLRWCLPPGQPRRFESLFR